MRISDWSSDVCSSYLYLSSSPLASASQSIANASRDRLEETISIATLDPSDLGQIIYIARAERNQIIAAPLMVGSTLPSHCTSMGRVLLAAADAVERATWLEQIGRASCRESVCQYV